MSLIKRTGWPKNSKQLLNYQIIIYLIVLKPANEIRFFLRQLKVSNKYYNITTSY